MIKNEELNELSGQVYDNALKIKYVLNCAFFKSESSQETTVLGDLAISLTEKIIDNMTQVLEAFEQKEAVN